MTLEVATTRVCVCVRFATNLGELQQARGRIARGRDEDAWVLDTRASVLVVDVCSQGFT